MNEPNEVFSKVPNENKTCTYRIKTEWEEGYFRLFIFEGSNSWFALVTKDNIKMLADQHELEPTIYFKNLREYICYNHSAVTFNIVKKQFVIFRSIEKERLRIKYFFINLEKLNYQETIESVVDDLSAKWTEMHTKLKTLEEQKLEAQSQKMLYERKYEEFVELKRKSDLQMYSAFALCLNEKKHRIRFLTELLDEYQTGRKQKCTTTPSSAKTNKATKTISSTTIKPKETISDSESNPSDNYNTDDEKNDNVDEQIPGTSKDNLDFLGGDSLPPPSLPKRIRNNKRKVSQVPIENSSPNLKQETEVNRSSKEAVDVQKAMDVQEANSDDETYNTQDLLDRM